MGSTMLRLWIRPGCALCSADELDRLALDHFHGIWNGGRVTLGCGCLVDVLTIEGQSVPEPGVATWGGVGHARR